MICKDFSTIPHLGGSMECLDKSNRKPHHPSNMIQVCLLSAFLAKSGGEVHQKCERTLPDAYLSLYESFVCSSH